PVSDLSRTVSPALVSRLKAALPAERVGLHDLGLHRFEEHDVFGFESLGQSRRRNTLRRRRLLALLRDALLLRTTLSIGLRTASGGPAEEFFDFVPFHGRRSLRVKLWPASGHLRWRCCAACRCRPARSAVCSSRECPACRCETLRP